MGKTWQRVNNGLATHSGRILTLLILLYVVLFTAALAYKWETYQTGYDQTYFQQPLWNTIQGRFMQQSDFNYSDSAFAVDFMPFLIAFVPFFWLVPSPHTLFFLESLILGLGALPIFWLARARLQNSVVALGFVLVYMLNPTLEYFNLLPFNLRASGLVLLLYAFYFFEKRRFWPFALCAGLALLTRTEVSLVVAMFGLYGLLYNWTARNRNAKKYPIHFWFVPLLAGLAYFVIVITYILPLFIQPGTMVLPPSVTATGPVQLTQKQKDYIAGSNTLVATNYGDLGQSLPDVLQNTLTHPDKTIQRIFTLKKFEYLLAMLLPFAFLSLFAPILLVFALPILGLNLLSLRPSQYDYTTHYSALLLFPLTVGAIYGLANILGFLEKRQNSNRTEPNRKLTENIRFLSPQYLRLLVILSLVGAVGVAQLVEKNPLPGVIIHAEKHNVVVNINKIIQQIPPNASVTATSFLGAHLQPRQYTYDFPLALYQPPASAMQYILLDTNASALYLPANGEALDGKIPIDFVQHDGRWKLVARYVVKDQLDRRREQPREIQLWQNVSPTTPPLLTVGK